MPRKAKELTAVEVRRLTESAGRYAVGGVQGLCLQVSPNRSASWVLRATIGGRRCEVGLGGYPSVTLSKAREKARDVREQLAAGVDPVAERRALREALKAEQAKRVIFSDAAYRCHEARRSEFSNAKHSGEWIRTLERYAFPVFGSLPVADIETPHVLAVLEPIWTTKTETATRVRQRIESVLAWAKVAGLRAGDNPARWDENLKELLPKASKVAKVKHHRALPWQEMPSFMAELRQREGMGALALEFAILTASRSGEVRGTCWDEIDLEARIWTVPAERMKRRRLHRVPLSEAAIALLKRVPAMQGSPLVFTSSRGGQLSDMSLSAVCKRMGVDAVPHGFRSSFKDWARNRSAYPDEVSELALAHVNNDATRAAYARDELLPQRARQLEDWARYLSQPASGAAEVVGIREGVATAKR